MTKDLLKSFEVETGQSIDEEQVFSVPEHGDAEGLNAFLERYRPSAMKATATQSYVWVTVPHRRPNYTDEEKHAMQVTLAKAQQELEDLKKACDAIDQDEKIPVRASKAKGKGKAQRKKDLTSVFAEQKVPALVKEGGRPLTSGKWLYFKSAEYVDATFGILARSIADGPLSRLEWPAVHTVKAALKDEDRPEHMIALYYDDCFNPDAGRAVMECILRHHFLPSRAAKTDLYTLLGIDSKVSNCAPSTWLDRASTDGRGPISHLSYAHQHWSGLRTSLYTCDSLVPKDLQDEYKQLYEEDKASKMEQQKQARKAAQSPDKRDLTSKSFANKEAVKDEGGFESDDDEESSTSKVQGVTVEGKNAPISAEPSPSKPAPSVPPVTTKSAAKSESDSDTEDEDEMVVRHKSPVKKPNSSEALPSKSDSNRSRDKAVDEPTAGVKRALPPGFASEAVKRPQTAAEMTQRRKALKKSSGF